MPIRVDVIGTGSKGNCYALYIDGEILILECGNSQFDSLKKALKYDFSAVKGAVVSHCHGDHAGDVKKLLQSGIHTLSTSESFTECERYSHFIHKAVHLKGVKFGSFKVLPLQMVHDVECFGFLITFNETTLFFATDTTDIPYALPQVDYLMIEANFANTIIDEKLFDGSLHRSLHDRIINSHLSLERAQFFIVTQKKLKGIILIHLSHDNADAEVFQQKIAQQTGVITYVAQNNKTIDFF